MLQKDVISEAITAFLGIFPSGTYAPKRHAENIFKAVSSVISPTVD